MRIRVLLGIAIPLVAWAQEPEEKVPWHQLDFLVGEWEGTGEGKWGYSTTKRSYEFVLGGRFIMGKNASVYESQPKNPTGETHNNWDFIGYDKERSAFVWRQFDNESFVNTYILDSVYDEGRTLQFTSGHIENFMPGWRARETLRWIGDNEFTETFELAGPEAEFKVFVHNRFKRKP